MIKHKLLWIDLEFLKTVLSPQDDWGEMSPIE